jgi:hypothetical protein
LTASEPPLKDSKALRTEQPRDSLEGSETAKVAVKDIQHEEDHNNDDDNSLPLIAMLVDEN